MLNGSRYLHNGAPSNASRCRAAQQSHPGASAVASALLKNKAPSVVTNSPAWQSFEDTSGGSIAYRISKAAVNMVMRSVAVDLALSN
jgi:NAD(P)-dependent dehydrogenase (short-subunit alcohol dehydrogenase family)